MKKRILSLMLALMLIVTILPIQKAEATTGGKLIALTFDDGPNRTYTKQLLDGLKSRGAKATFFMLGENAASNQSLVKRAYDEGHEIASHTYSHLNLNAESWSTVSTEISKTKTVLDKVCGTGTRYLVRPPYGNANATVLSALGAPAIIWSVDTNDWKYRNSTTVYNNIVNSAYDGAIVLCHDIHATTIPAALQAIDTLQARGYEFVTVSELFRRRGVSMTNGIKYYSCKSNGTDLGAVQAPVITYEPAEGGIRVTITSPSGAPVYYTKDDSRFTQESTLYSGSFVTQCPVKIRAVAAFNLNGGRSKETTFELNLLPCSTPKMTVSGNQLTIRATSGAPIYYTLDGSKATVYSTCYTETLTVNPGMVIRAVAGGGNYMVSSEATICYSDNGNWFTDVMPGQWYYSAIDTLTTLGLMNGVGNNAFDPNGDTTRAMMVTLLYRYSGQTLEQGWTKTNSFTDVPDGSWYAEAVEWAYRNYVIQGYPDGTFRPSQNITRQEMAQMFAHYLEYGGNALCAGVDCRGQFGDGAQIGDWALESVNAVVAAGLLQGDNLGNLNPSQTATRAETGTVLLRMKDLEAQMEQEKQEQEKATEPTETALPIEPTQEIEQIPENPETLETIVA